jgi:hypothetical protein
MEHLGLDVTNKGDRDLYRQTMLDLRDSGQIECLAHDYGLPCGIVKLN